MECIGGHTTLFRTAVLSGLAARDPYFSYMSESGWQKTFENWGLGNERNLRAAIESERKKGPEPSHFVTWNFYRDALIFISHHQLYLSAGSDRWDILG